MDSVLSKLKWLGILLPVLYLGVLDFLCPILYPIGQSHVNTHIWLFVLMVLGSGAFCFAVCRTLASGSEVDRQVTLLQEQQRLARELHDDLSQLVAYLHLTVTAWEQELRSTPDPPLSKRVRELRLAAENIYDKVRDVVCCRRTEGVGGENFFPALRACAHEFSARTGIRIRLKFPKNDTTPIPGPVATQLFQIVRESLSNIYRHSGVHEGTISAAMVGKDLTLTISDHGRGFVPQNGPSPFSQGLQIMRERAEMVRGSLSVTTAPGEGTRVMVRVPLDREKAKWKQFESSSLTTTLFSAED